uniref:RNA-directed DNA polymerase n=1 Tax=Strongyloides venezuelensis TaxID=75913 RepID=A0A0K0FRB1_STRVS
MSQSSTSTADLPRIGGSAMATGKLVQSIGEFNASQERIDDWLERLDVALLMAGITDETQQRLVLIRDMGPKAFAEVKSKLEPMKLRDTPLAKLVEILMDLYGKKKEGILVSRLELTNLKQKADEDARQFSSRLSALARECDLESWGPGRDGFLYTVFVNGLRDDGAKKFIIASKEERISLEKAVELCRGYEAANPMQSNIVEYIGSNGMKCQCCGRNGHSKEKCRMKDASCRKCGRKGHLQCVCRSGKRFENKIKEIEFCNNESDSNSMFSLEMDMVESKNNNQFTKEFDIRINGFYVKGKLDTGADRSIISKEIWKTIGSPMLKKNAVGELVDVNGNGLEILGSFMAKLEAQGKRAMVELRVFSKEKCLIGRDVISLLKLNLNEIFYGKIEEISESPEFLIKGFIEKYPKLFKVDRTDGSNLSEKLYLKPDAVPKFVPARNHSLALRNVIKNEIQRLIAANIFQPVGTSRWASLLVSVPKGDGTLRLCGDYSRTVNPQLQVEQFPISSLTVAINKIAGGCVFAKIDLKNAFNQLHMDSESMKMLTVSTSEGLMAVKRLQPGIASAPAIFQHHMYEWFGEIDMVSCYFDDIIVVGKSKNDLISRLDKVFKKLDEMGLFVNAKKLEILKDQVIFLGHLLSKEGRNPNPEKIQEIINMRRPENQVEVHTFIGKCMHYSDYIDHATLKAKPLYDLIKKGMAFKWEKIYKECFQNLKKELVEIIMLSHYDGTQLLVLATDASEYGLRAVLLMRDKKGKERPLSHASKTFSPSQKNWSQLDKEAAAIIFGKKANLPITIVKRVDRWNIILRRYQYDIEYINTKEFAKADCLSRLPSPEIMPEDKEMDEIVERLLEDYPLDLEIIKKEQQKDSIIAAVIQLVLTSFPIYVKDEEIKKDQAYQNELNMMNGVLFKNICVIIPVSLRDRVLALLHEGHFGATKVKLLARSYCYWPGISESIEILTKSCEVCQLHGETKKNNDLHSWQKPEKPWKRVHVDFAGPFMGSMWLLMTDSFSKFPHITKMGRTESKDVIAVFRQIFSLQGNPLQLVSDNRKNFISREMESFLRERRINHIRTPFFHPMSNGHCERLVKTFKGSMKKMVDSGVADSPSELLFGLKVPEVPKFHEGESVYVRDYKSDRNWENGKVNKVGGQNLYYVQTGTVYNKMMHSSQIKKKLLKLGEQEKRKLPSRSAKEKINSYKV